MNLSKSEDSNSALIGNVARKQETIGRASMKCKIKKWHAVALWTWNLDDDVCGICQIPFDGAAPGYK